MGYLSTTLYFLLAIALLITVHEWGHFLMARLMNVKVLCFSIGFGKPLVSWRGRHGTDYVIALFPLGGYVKMLDEAEGPVEKSQLPYAFNRQSVWARMLIVIGGPLFNMLFALLALWLMFMVGLYTLTPIVGSVAADSIAKKAALKPMDEIISINQQPVLSWRGFQLSMMNYLGEPQSVPVAVKNTLSGEARVIHLNLTQWQLNSKRPDVLASLGIKPFLPVIAPVIGQLVEGQVASRAGLAKGDRIIAIDGKKVSSWYGVVMAVSARANKATVFTIRRNDAVLNKTLTPAEQVQNGKVKGFIGVMPKVNQASPTWFRLQRYSFFKALAKATTETWRLTHMTFSMIGKFVTAKVSLGNLSGPIGIAKGAGDSARGGLAYYLSFLALISISLGVLNSLPIPVLDGGHLLFLVVELLTGRKVSAKLIEKSMLLGLVFLLSLMMLAMVNDIGRLFL